MDKEDLETEIEKTIEVVDLSEKKELDEVSDSIDEKLAELRENNQKVVNFNTLNIFNTDIDTADFNAEKDVEENRDFSCMVNNVVEKYNQEYGTNVTYDNLDTYLLSRADKSTEEKQIEDVVKDEVAYESIKYLENKYFLVVAKYLDSQMNQMLRTDIKDNITPESIAMLDRLLATRKELDKLSSKLKTGASIGSKLDNIRGKNKVQFDEETMRLINLLKESSIKKHD